MSQIFKWSFMRIFKIIKYSFGILWENSPKYTLIKIICVLYNQLYTIALAYFLKKVVDCIEEQEISSMVIYLILYFATNIFADFCMQLQEYVEKIIDSLLERKIFCEVIDKIIMNEYCFLDNKENYEKIEIVKNNYQAIKYFLLSGLEMLSSAASVFMITTIFLQSTVKIMVFMLIFEIPLILFKSSYANISFEMKNQSTKDRRILNYIFNIFSDKFKLFEFRVNLKEKKLRKLYEIISKKIYKREKKFEKENFYKTLLFMVVPRMIFIFAIVNLSFGIIYKKNSISDLYYYLSLSTQYVLALSILIRTFYEFKNYYLEARQINEFIKEEKKVMADEVDIVQFESLEFKNVYFKYSDKQEWVLKNVCFRVNKGEKIAIVGVNGSGKSTILKLILKLYIPSKGEIYINNININKINKESIYRLFSIYTQENALYPISIRDNICLFANDRKNLGQRYMKVTKMFECQKIFDNFKMKDRASISRIFDENGIDLSQGQKQKILLCRAFLDEKKCILLDEPTSAIDNNTEKILLAKMKYMIDDGTLVLICHRVSNIELASKVIVFENGEIKKTCSKENILNEYL